MSDLLSEDPAAEFLQQEEDQLRELGIDENQFNVPTLNNEAPAINYIDEFETEVDLVPQEPLVNGYMESAPMAVPAMLIPAEEPESLGIWRDQKAATLQQQEQDERDASVAWSEKAKKELEDWYNRYNEQLEKVKNENRAAQDQFIEEMTDTKPGNEWEKVARFCDFNPKYSKNTKDVSRMRSLLLQLKQNPLVR